MEKGARAQQALQASAVGSFDNHPGIDREAACVSVSDHVFGVMCIYVAARHKGPQDAFAHVGLHCCDGALIETSCRMKNHTRLCRVGLFSSIDALRLRFSPGNNFNHPSDHTNVKVHMRVQATAKPMYEMNATAPR